MATGLGKIGSIKSMKSYTYRVIIEPDGKTFHGHVPALPGCHTWGKDMDETREHLRDAGPVAVAISTAISPFLHLKFRMTEPEREQERELITPHKGDKRYVKRDASGQFTEKT